MKKRIAFCFNLAIFVMTCVGFFMSAFNVENSRLLSKGLSNLKYYTTLSNIFAGVTALVVLLSWSKKGASADKLSKTLTRLKLMAAASVMVTFLTVLLFLGPLYGFETMYKNANFWFHLVIPLTTFADFCFIEELPDIRFFETLFATIPTVLYGVCYLINIGINGVGEWPDTNDWYAFTSWGMGVGCLIFSVIIAVSWLMAILLRGIYALAQRAKDRNNERVRKI